ncbi:helix-turn-helix domain-containing protein [Mesorhizobium sp.]|uniref:helix-turn-helix domain-containing protein n=1 Tax=Mesorhizobium sp. TaxID=1871066 RepID=UPI000FE4A327|nr:helix-turn-helix domain-containing protein [Mesorhizobium sp.]RWE03854.1 MAG: helix-turn-helix domain-containing protein [Mesorhizobium sp.]
MAIVTRRRADNFTIIPNDIMADGGLSFEAIGLLCYLLSKPNDWSVNIEDLRRQGGIGKDKVYRIINDLIDARLIARVVHRFADGRVREVEYIVYNERQPLPEKPETANPETAQPETENPDVLLSTDNHQELNLEMRAKQLSLTMTALPVSPPGASFETWWKLYPEKVGKGAARKAFERALRKTTVESLVAGVQRYIATKPADRAWCHASTWLNQERWTDEPTTLVPKRAEQKTLGSWALDRLNEMEGAHVVGHQH